MEGKVKFFNGPKGYGFISGDDGQEYFVHKTAIKGDARLNQGDDVSFEAVQADRGIQAQNVKVISGGGSRAPAEQADEPADEPIAEPAESAPEDSEDF